MNCRDFQHELFEYVEGSLSPKALAAAEEHLGGCVTCRETVSQQRLFAQSMSSRLHAATASLQLPPELGRRVIAKVREQAPRPAERSGWAWLWQRLELPLAVAACAVVLLGGMWFAPRDRVTQAVRSQPETARGAVSVQLSYVVPTYTFRRDGAHVVDALVYQTTVVNKTLRLDSPRRN